jgi:ribosome-binding protein 1
MLHDFDLFFLTVILGSSKKMDIQTGLVYVAVVVLSAVVIFVISMFGIKEKTYEEAIAEQRNMPEENLLLGRSGKDKVKDKKQKKTGKKVKEKPAEREKKQSEAVSSVPVQPSSQEKSHMDLEEPETEVFNKRPPQVYTWFSSLHL